MPRAEAQQTEDWVEEYLRKECEALGALCKKNQHLRGWPDRTIYWYEGVTDLVETKRPKGGKFEPLQVRTHTQLSLRGHTILVINTRLQVDAYIQLRLPYALPGAVKIRFPKYAGV